MYHATVHYSKEARSFRVVWVGQMNPDNAFISNRWSAMMVECEPLLNLQQGLKIFICLYTKQTTIQINLICLGPSSSFPNYNAAPSHILWKDVLLSLLLLMLDKLTALLCPFPFRLCFTHPPTHSNHLSLALRIIVKCF